MIEKNTGAAFMNILSIGNSFSQDAQRYLHRIAAADGVTLSTFNLYIGGCSLARHYHNMLSDGKEYTLEMNGESTGFKSSLKEALLNRSWDIITLQQVSHEAPYYDLTYQPYLDKLAAYVRLCAPKAKFLLQQTWAYEEGSQRLNEELHYAHYQDMLRDVVASYEKAAQAVSAEGIIPSGEVLGALLENSIPKVHRDTFHASYGLGRYTLGLTWYRYLTGNDLSGNSFAAFDEPVSPEEVEIAKKCVAQVLARYGK